MVEIPIPGTSNEQKPKRKRKRYLTITKCRAVNCHHPNAPIDRCGLCFPCYQRLDKFLKRKLDKTQTEA